MIIKLRLHKFLRNKTGKLNICGLSIKFANLILAGLFIMDCTTGQTVNQVYYLEVLKRLLEKFRWKRPELFANNSCILHHDNEPAHTALSVREFLATKQII